MKMKINKDEHSPTMVIEFISETNELDHFLDKLHPLLCVIGQHNLQFNTLDNDYDTDNQETTRKLIIKDTTDAFLLDLQSYLLTGDVR
jgi:hypothetical protein